MDIQKTAREIGLFETAANLEKVRGSTDVIQKVGASMPMPDDGAVDRIGQAADWLLGFGKDKYMFLTPEIALIEEMGKRSGRKIEAIIVVPHNLDPEAKERLLNNLPHGTAASAIAEPSFPQPFFPGNGLMVISGYLGGGRAMALPDTYRMAGHYSGFRGKWAFVPYVELDAAARYNGWMEISRQRLIVWNGGVVHEQCDRCFK